MCRATKGVRSRSVTRWAGRPPDQGGLAAPAPEAARAAADRARRRRARAAPAQETKATTCAVAWCPGARRMEALGGCSGSRRWCVEGSGARAEHRAHRFEKAWGGALVARAQAVDDHAVEAQAELGAIVEPEGAIGVGRGDLEP